MKRHIVYYPFLFVLCLFGVFGQLHAVDFNNTQVSSQIYKESLNWNEIQDRNGILYAPNTEQPNSGYLRKVYSNGQVKMLARISLGLIDQAKTWKENGIPVYSVEVIPGSLTFNTIPDSS